MKVSELIRRLEQDGWSEVRQSGSHRVYRHPVKAGQLTVPVTVAVHRGIEVATLHSILKQAGLK